MADRKLIVLSVVQRVAATNGAAGDSHHSLTLDEADSSNMIHMKKKSPLAPMMDLRAGFGAACFDNKIVVAGKAVTNDLRTIGTTFRFAWSVRKSTSGCR